MANKDGRRRFGWVRKLPSGRIQASYLGPDGVRRYAPNTFESLASANRWLTLTEAEIIRGEWMAPEAGRVELTAYAERWIKERRLALRTRELYDGLFRLHVQPYLGQLTLDTIRTSTVRTWRTRLLSEGRSATVAAKAYRLLRAVLNTAVEDGVIRQNPCRVKGAD